MSVTSGFEILPAIDLRGGRVVRLRAGRFRPRDVVQRRSGGRRDRALPMRARGWLHVVDLDGARTGSARQRRGRRGDRRGGGGAGQRRGRRWVCAIAAAVDAALLVGRGSRGRRDGRHRRPGIRGRARGDPRRGSDRRRARRPGRPGDRPRLGGRRPSASMPSTAIERLAAVGVDDLRGDRDRPRRPPRRPGLALYKRLVAATDAGSIIASGGIATLDDLRELRETGCAGAIVGRAIYEGRTRHRRGAGRRSVARERLGA